MVGEGIKSCLIVKLLLVYTFIVSCCVVSVPMLLTRVLIWPINRTLYRKIVCKLAPLVHLQLVFLYQRWSGSSVTFYYEHAADIPHVGKEHSLVIFNHRSPLDYLVPNMLAHRANALRSGKLVLKADLARLPGIGWMWSLLEHVFVRRNWEEDRHIISRDMEALCEYPRDYPVQLLLFCEGTRFTKEKHEASNEVARKKALPELRHHLLPRTKGFVRIMQCIKGKFASVLDCTCVFKQRDGRECTIMDLLQGIPVHADVYMRRFPLDQIPTDTDDACADWLYRLYREKDGIYDNHLRDGGFTTCTEMTNPSNQADMVVASLWAFLLWSPLAYFIGAILVYGSTFTKITLVVVSSLISCGIHFFLREVALQCQPTHTRNQRSV